MGDNKINTVVPSKGLFTDYSKINNSKEIWTYARNVTINSHLGQITHIQNEPSTKFCAEFPYSFLGSIKLKNDRWAIFTTDEKTNHEIGIFNSSDCTYTKLVNSACLDFNLSNPIFGAAKETKDCTESIYWVDGQRNEIRYLNLNNIPYTYTIKNDNCDTKKYTNNLDCDRLSFTKKITIPCITLRTLNTGFLENGTYQVTLAYSVNGTRLSDYFGVTNPIQVFNHGRRNGSLSINITDLETDFDSYNLILIATVNNITSYYDLGEYNINQTSHVIDNIKTEFTPISNKEITVKRPYYQKADYLIANDQYLFVSGISIRPKLDYQKQALNIKAEYTVSEAPIDYYERNNEVGYYRDEVYSFGIQWLFEDGEWSEIFHIPGRLPKKNEKNRVYGKDVFEQIDNCNGITNQEFWQVYNTAGSMSRVSAKTVCNLKKIGYGEMAYHESVEQYPDNKEMFGETACTKIRHHKFPDECKVPRYTNDDGNIKLNILGIQFKNIQHPLDANKKRIKDIKGYRIWRGDRNNNKSIIARGLMSNVRSYTDKLQNNVKYSNYPYNDLSSDQLLSSTQTLLKQNKETNYNALTNYSKNEFTFYGPHTLIDRVGLGDYLQFETEEKSTVEGFFEEVYKHPKSKLISDKVLAFALLVGAVDGYLKAFTGKKVEFKYTDGVINSSVVNPTAVPPVTNSTLVLKNIKAVEREANALNNWGAIDAGTATIGVNKYILGAIKNVGKIGAFAYFAAETAQKVIQAFYDFSDWKQYALQYNSHAFFNRSVCIKPENKRRKIQHYQYLSSGVNTIQDRSNEKYNNLFKENNVYLRLNADVEDLKGDNSRVSIGKNNLCSDVFRNIKSKASLFYSTVKQTNLSQYGKIDNIRYLNIDSCYNKIDKNKSVYESGSLLGGDCYINRFSINIKTDFFANTLYDQPDGFPFDYRTNKTLAYPRYWVDSHQYDLSEIVPTTLSATNYPKESNLPQNKYNLDCKNKKGFSLIKNQYFYTSHNGVLEFIVESDYNLDLRDWKDKTPQFYTKNSDIKELFKNKGDDKVYEEFIYDKSFSKQNNEEFFYQQVIDFNPLTDCSFYLKNKVAYTLPSYTDQKYDNWLNFLPNSYYSFSQSQFGNLTTIKLVDHQQLLFLFDKSSPYTTPGVQELNTADGSSIYLGDGTLIRAPRPLSYTDDYYGNCQSRFSFNNTKFGFFYASQRKGNWFQYGKGLDEISRNGMFYWFDKYLPSQLLKTFPNFIDNDNPMNGIGLLSAYDPSFEILYLTKKDYTPKYKEITYDDKTNKFTYKGLTVLLHDRKYFNDVSFTISYSPSLEVFISWHDYQPVSYINSENHFFSIINENGKSSIHEHNVRCDSFSNFYNVDYPHAFRVPINNGQEVEILKSIEYQADTLLFKDNCKDFYQVLDTTYDKAIISNQEQISGNILLNIKEKNNMLASLRYDKVLYNALKDGYDIYVDKNEQKYRFNKFSDIVKDRGEFSITREELIQTDESGYKFSINKQAIDYNKSIYEKKKFRNTQSELYLERTISNQNKHLFYLANNKQTSSPR